MPTIVCHTLEAFVLTCAMLARENIRFEARTATLTINIQGY